MRWIYDKYVNWDWFWFLCCFLLLFVFSPNIYEATLQNVVNCIHSVVRSALKPLAVYTWEGRVRKVRTASCRGWLPQNCRSHEVHREIPQETAGVRERNRNSCNWCNWSSESPVVVGKFRWDRPYQQAGLPEVSHGQTPRRALEVSLGPSSNCSWAHAGKALHQGCFMERSESQLLQIHWTGHSRTKRFRDFDLPWGWNQREQDHRKDTGDAAKGLSHFVFARMLARVAWAAQGSFESPWSPWDGVQWARAGQEPGGISLRVDDQKKWNLRCM